jgi:regulator of replication initiation timing
LFLSLDGRSVNTTVCIAKMSAPNPFVFTGVNGPQLAPSEASVRTEMARAKQDLMRAKQDIIILQREVQKLGSENGLAQALANAKVEIQEAQRESKRALLAERIARAALETLRKTVHEQTREEDMSRNPVPTQQEVDDLKRELVDLWEHNGKLQVELDQCKGDLATAQARETLTIKNHDEYIQNLEHRAYTEIENAKTPNSKLQADYNNVQSQLADADSKIEQLERRAAETETELDTIRKDNNALDKDLEYQKALVDNLHEHNDNIIADLDIKEARRKVLARERDDFELQLAETRQALEAAEQSEAKVHNEYQQYKDENESLARELAEQNQKLVVDMDAQQKQIDEHGREVAVKDERIAYLEQQNHLLEHKLEESETHPITTSRIPRPPTLRNVSTTSNRSLFDELDEHSDAEFDDNESLAAASDVDDVDIEANAVPLSYGVFGTVSTAPRYVPEPSFTMTIRDAVFTAPRDPKSLILEHSQISDSYSIAPHQPAAPQLSLYDETIACFSPIELAVPSLSMLDATVVDSSPIIPVAPTFSFYDETVECLSPIDPKPARLAMASVDAALDYAPIEPTTLAPPVTSTQQQLSMRMISDATLNLEPSTPATIATRNVVTQTTAPDFDIEPDRRDSAVTNTSRDSSDHTIHDASTRKSSRAVPAPSNVLRRKYTPQDPFSRLPNHTGTHLLDKLPPGYPLEDVEYVPAAPEHTATEPVHAVHVKGTVGPRSSFHAVLHVLFVFLAFYCMYVQSKLRAWERANGVGSGEGYGNVNNRFGPFGNGHIILSMLPTNFLSADSWVPEKAADVITSTVSVFESWMGLVPTSLY